MRRRYDTGGLAAVDDENADDQVMYSESEDMPEPGAEVTSSGGIPALDIPGAKEAFAMMARSSEAARKALTDARQSIMARHYSRADALLAASAALGAPTRAGSTAESFGAMAGALRGPLAAKREFETQQQKDLLGVNTQLAGLDEREATARLALAQLQARLKSDQAKAGNDRVVGADGKLHYMSHDAARDPSVVAWAPPSTTITNDMRQESEEDKAIGKGMADQFLKLQQAGLDAPHQLAKYQRLTNLLDDVNTGRFTPTFATIASAGESLGLKLDPKLGVKQGIEALSREIALTLRNPAGGAGMPGALSDQDRAYLESMTPGLSKTPAGNKIIIETAKKLAQRDIEIAKLARDYRRKNKKLDEGLYDEIADFANKNPLFPAKEKAASPIATGAPAAAVAGAASVAPGEIPPLLRRPDLSSPREEAAAAPEERTEDDAPAVAPPAAEAALRANPTDEMKRFFITKYGYLPNGIPL
jgi:hypothetical protein